MERLQSFWERVTRRYPWPVGQFGSAAHGFFNRTSAFAALVAGQPHFFRPIFPPAVLRPRGTPGALSVYDTALLRDTLEELVDFGRINSGQTRLSLGAVNIRLGNLLYFDNTEREITPDHVTASGALPPGFPPVRVDGELYWDGGLVSNTPLAQVLELGSKKDTLVFQVDLFSARGDVPGHLLEVEERRKHIVYSSRTRLNTDNFREKHELRRAIVRLFERLPAEAQRGEEIKSLGGLGEDHAVTIVHLIYRPQSYEGQSIDYEFSRTSMEQHWQAGLGDARRTFRHPQWFNPPSDAEGVRIYDITQTDLECLHRQGTGS